MKEIKDINDFTKEFGALLKEALSAEGHPDYELMENTVRKPNRIYRAYSVMPAGGNLGVNVDVSEAYELYSRGVPLEKIVAMNCDMACSCLSNLPDINSEINMDAEELRENLAIQLVTMKGNEELLSSVPHEKMLDMALIYRVITGEGYSAIVTRDLLKSMNFPEAKLHEAAVENAEKKRPAVLHRLESVIEEIAERTGIPKPSCGPGGMEACDILLATSRGNFLGASVMVYPGFLKNAADFIGESFYILPSSIHEILLIPDSAAMPAAYLKDMVKSINSEVLEGPERLTDNVYHYDMHENLLEFGEDYDERAGFIGDISSAQ